MPVVDLRVRHERQPVGLARVEQHRRCPTCSGSASRPSRPASQSPAVWKHSSTSRGALVSGASGGDAVVRQVESASRAADPSPSRHAASTTW